MTPWTVALQASLSGGFPRQEYWSGLPPLSQGELRYPQIQSVSPALAERFFTTEPPGKPIHIYKCIHSILDSFPVQAGYRVLNRVACAINSRFLLVICFIYSSMYMSVPVFQFIIPPTCLPSGNHKFVKQ